MTKALCLVLGILAVLVGWFSLTWGQPVGEVDPHSIHKDGTTTTTAEIPFAEGLSCPVNERIYLGTAATATKRARIYGYEVGAIGGSALAIYGGEAETGDSYGGVVNIIGGDGSFVENADGGGVNIRGGDAYIGDGGTVTIWGGQVEYGQGGDVILYGFPSSSNGIVAVAPAPTFVPAEARGAYGFYVQGDAWVDGKITADDFIVAPANQALVMRGGTDEPVVVQAATPVATPAAATDPNDLFVEGILESVEEAKFKGGVELPAEQSLNFANSGYTSEPYLACLGSPTFSCALNGARGASGQGGAISIAAMGANAANQAGGNITITSGNSDGSANGSVLRLRAGAATPAAVEQGVQIGIATPSHAGWTRDSLIVKGNAAVVGSTYLDGLAGPGLLKIDSDELVAIATPATDYIATEVDPNAVLADGTRALSADWDAGSYEIRTKTLDIDEGTGGGTLIDFSTLGSKILDSANTWLHISGLGTIDDGTGISLPVADEAYDIHIGYGNNATAVRMGSTDNELVVKAGPYGQVEAGYGFQAGSTYSGVSANTCAVWNADKTLVSGVLQPTPTPITTGNLTASSPIVLSATRQVVGGAAAISHATTAGNKHVPTSGSVGQILRNTGVSGTAGWGTVTESSGALSNITNIAMTGSQQMNSDTSQLIQGAGRDVFIQYDGTNWLFDISVATSSIVFNESGFDTNFRIEGDTDANLFTLDAGLEKIGIGVAAPSSKLDVNGDVELASTGAVYFGAPDADGSWRIVRSGNNLVFERRESSAWVTKSTMTP